MGEISVWVKGCQKHIGGVTHRTTAAEIVRFTLTECLWRTTEKARRSGRCYALFENWRGCQRLIPPCKRIYKLWKLWGLERIHVKFVVKKVAMETLARKDFGEYVEASQLKVPKRHVALRTQPHALDTDDSDQTTSSDGVGLFVIDESGSEGGSSPNSRRKRMLLKHVLNQNDQLHTLTKTVEEVDEEILFFEAKLHHFRVVADGNDYVQHAYLNGKQQSANTAPSLNMHDHVSDLNHVIREAGAGALECDTPDPVKAHKHSAHDFRAVGRVKSKSLGSNEDKSNQSENRTKMDFNSKSNTKIVVVNPLPRNDASCDQKETGQEVLKDGDNRSAITTTAYGLSVPRSKLPISKTKRRMRNGSRPKRKIPGLYEFEQSCEWLKVMDKELKRLESMENLSFVDWDSESLLSEKQLTFASGNRKFRFRSAFSGKEYKQYDLNENVTKDDWLTDPERAFSKLQIDKTSAFCGKSTSPLSQLAENENLNHDKDDEQSHLHSNNLDDCRPNSPSLIGVRGIRDWDNIDSGASSTKPTEVIDRPIGGRSEEVLGDTKSTEELKVCDGKTTDYEQPRCSYGDKCRPPSIPVDDFVHKNECPEERSIKCSDDQMTPHNQIPVRNTNENVAQEENSTSGNMLSSSKFQREDGKGCTFGNFYHQDLPHENDSKNHQDTINRKYMSGLNRTKDSSEKTGVSSPKWDLCNSERPPLPPSIAASQRPVSQSDLATPSSVSKSPKNTLGMRETPADSNRTKVLGPVLHPKSSPVSVRRVPKPPVYYPTEASGPILYVPREGQSTPKHPKKETILKQHDANFSLGSYVVPEEKASVVTAVHPRVEQLRSTRFRPGAVSKTSDIHKGTTLATNGVSSGGNNRSQTSLTVGLVLGTTKTNAETLEPDTSKLKYSTPILPSAATDFPLSRASMKSPDQGLGAELFSTDEKIKLQENDSSSDTGMSSLHSQDSGISNASVVIETWV